MRFILRLILVTSVYFLLGNAFHLEWYYIIIIPFMIGFLIHGNYFNVFISGFLGVGLIWFVTAWVQDVRTEGFVTTKISSMTAFIGDSSLLIVMIGVLGGICSGLASMTGNSLRLMFVRKKKKRGFV